MLIDREWLAARLIAGADLSISRPIDVLDDARLEWATIEAAFNDQCPAHSGLSAQDLRLSPLIVENVVVGLTARPIDEQWTTFFLAPEARGLGLGDRALERIDAEGLVLGAPESSQLAEYAMVRAFLPESQNRSIRLFKSFSTIPQTTNSSTLS